MVQNSNKQSAEKINDSLSIDFLDINRKKIKKSIFENVWGTSKDGIIPMSDVSYKVLYNAGNILSLAIEAEGCGAYCEHFTRYYCFHTKTGKKIRITDLLTKRGIQLLSDSIVLRKQNILKKKLLEIEDSLSSAAVIADNDSKEYFLQMKELYENCLAATDFINFEYTEFYIIKSKMYFILNRCSAHYNRAIDELDVFILAFTINDWKQFFTSAASKLLIR